MVAAFLFCKTAGAQTSWFADGYHGGIYGHYPLYVTKLMTDTLRQYPGWKINLEIEPETWDTVKAKDPEGYADFRQLFADQSVDGRIEYTNPSYGQSYLFPISGESIIRQFQYGMQKLKAHFPSAVFTTYSSEEPCFTSALPQLLTSLGFTHAVLKNPNTCWGGYTRAHGGETVNWTGPDGTAIITVPRYESEALEPHSTWQTIAWNNSATYIRQAIDQGIHHPIGMCLQDAGWRNGRWLGNAGSKQTVYTTWRNYFATIADTSNSQRWRLSQEDIQVSLVWGSQVLQRIAQQVRTAENNIVAAETMSSLATLYAHTDYPAIRYDSAWRGLLLSQHHDCWIVPYNGAPGDTWADKVRDWTALTNRISGETIQVAAAAMTGRPTAAANIAVYNTLGVDREEWLAVPQAMIANGNIKRRQTVTATTGSEQVLIKAKVPALGYAVVNAEATATSIRKGATVKLNKNGTYRLESSLYTLLIDPAKGGAITSLVAKRLHHKEFVAAGNNGLTALRGNFFTNGGMHNSCDNNATVTILEKGPARVAVQVKGSIASHTYTQIIKLTEGDDLIDCTLHIDYNGQLRVGENYKQDSGFQATDLHKAFYNDTDKLLLTFPLSLTGQRVYKDAPFDVTKSQLANTFFNSWDSIKNNIILNWVDVTDDAGTVGFALLTDHTTSYSQGAQFPLSLTVQYAGVGLWGRNYKTDSATHIHYALIPHEGAWDSARLNNQTNRWNTPLIASSTTLPAGTQHSLANINHTGWQVTSVAFDNHDLLIRLYNAEGSGAEHSLAFDCEADRAELAELNGNISRTLWSQEQQDKPVIRLAIPRFGVRTIRLVNARIQTGK